MKSFRADATVVNKRGHVIRYKGIWVEASTFPVAATRATARAIKLFRRNHGRESIASITLDNLTNFGKAPADPKVSMVTGLIERRF